MRRNNDKYFKRNAKNKLFTKQEGKCNLCKFDLDITLSPLDHIKPLALGGSNEISNLQLICIPCHSGKTKKDMKDIHKRSKECKNDK